LAIPPIIQDAIEKSNPILTPLIHSFSSKTHDQCVSDFFTNLNYEIAFFHETIRQLLDELPLDEELKNVLREPSLSTIKYWENPPETFERALHARLGPIEGVFKELSTGILATIQKVTKDKSLPVTLNDEDFVSEIVTQITQTWNTYILCRSAHQLLLHQQLERFWSKRKRRSFPEELSVVIKQSDKSFCQG
jgi:hypothetical protein